MNQTFARTNAETKRFAGRDEVWVSELSHDAPILDALAQWCHENGQPTSDSAWTRISGNLDRAGDSATLAYGHRDATRQVMLVRIFANGETNEPRRVIRADGVHTSIGRIEIRSFLDDPALPTLRKVLERMPNAEILRYRPGRRCTLSVPSSSVKGFEQTDVGATSASEMPTSTEMIAKVFTDGRGWAVAAAGTMIHRVASDGRLRFEVAEMLGWNSNLNLLSQSVVPGQPIVDRLFSAAGPALAAQMGDALASIPASKLVVPDQLDGLAQTKRSDRYLANLRQLQPDLARELGDLQRELLRAHSFLPRVEPVAIHGSPHAHQWLEADGRLGLIDFDRVSMGDPELDVATFLTEMAYEDPQKVPIEAICEAFRTTYESRNGALDPARLWTYCAHKHLSKALKGARSLRHDGADRAARCIQKAADALRQVSID